MFPVILQVVVIVEGDFLYGADVAQGHNPDASVNCASLGVGCAGMVQKSRRIPIHISIQIKLFIKAEDAGVFELALPERLLFVYFSAQIFQDAGSGRDGRARKSAHSVDRRVFEANKSFNLHSCERKSVAPSRFGHGENAGMQLGTNSNFWE